MMNKRFKEASEHGSNDGGQSGNALPKLNVQDLKEIKVSIRRHNVPEPAVSQPLQRNLEDPADLVLHRRGEGQHPIFARDDIVVNVDENLEERIVLKSPLRSDADRRSRSRSSSYRSRSPSERQYVENRNKPDLRGSSTHKRSETDSFRGRTHSKDARYKDRSPKPGTSKAGRESPGKDRGRSPRRDRERSPRKDRYRTDYSPKHRSRSRSPKKSSGYKSGALSRRRSSSPHPSRRYSRSPYASRKRTPSPHSKRYSRSPHTKKSPPREERSYTDSKSRRRSPSPYDRDRSRKSPYSRRHSRSPHKPEHYHKYRRRSQSPSRREGYSESRYRRRNRTPEKTRKHSDSKDATEYGEASTDFDYYGPEGFWIPGPLPRPRFLPRGVIPPPVIMPRGMMRPMPPYVVPRPYMPMPYPFRPRFPVAHSRPYRQRMIAAPSASAVTTTATTTMDPTSSTTTTPIALASDSSNPIVEEPSNVAENADSTE